MASTYRITVIVLIAVAFLFGLSESQQVEAFQNTLTLSMPEPYLPDISLKDDYRCFLVDLGLTQDTFVKAFRVVPGQEQTVHHVLLFVASPGNVEAAKAIDDADPGPGWQCFGGPGIAVGDSDEAQFRDLARNFSNSLGTWTPGVGLESYPESTGKPLNAGSHLVMQIHYNVLGVEAGQLQPDQSQVELTLADETESVSRLRFRSLIAPVELRCPGPYPKDSGSVCHRDFAISQLENTFFPQAAHLECGTTPAQFIERDIGFGDAQEFSCTTLATRNGLIYGAFNHMHLRGKSIKVELNPNTPNHVVLLDNPNWNFNFQEGVWFEEPVEMRFGDIIRTTCVFDNSGSIIGPDGEPLEPRYVTWGEGTTDEMCLGGIHYVSE